MQPKKEVSSQLKSTFREEICKPTKAMKEEEKYEIAEENEEKIMLLAADEASKITMNLWNYLNF